MHTFLLFLQYLCKNFFWGIDTLNNVYRTTRTFQNEKIGFFKKWGDTKKTVFFFFAFLVLFFSLITLEYRTNIKQLGTTKKTFKIKKWRANFIHTLSTGIRGIYVETRWEINDRYRASTMRQKAAVTPCTWCMHSSLWIVTFYPNIFTLVKNYLNISRF